MWESKSLVSNWSRFYLFFKFGHGAEVGEVMSAIMGGQGVGGVLASLTDIAAKLIFANDADAAMIFFAFPSVFMIVTGIIRY